MLDDARMEIFLVKNKIIGSFSRMEKKAQKFKPVMTIWANYIRCIKDETLQMILKFLRSKFNILLSNLYLNQQSYWYAYHK